VGGKAKKKTTKPKSRRTPRGVSSDIERAFGLEPLSYVRDKIRSMPDFPKPGILFRDITPVLADPKAFQIAVNQFVERLCTESIDGIVAIESRGFLFGAPVARALAAPLVLFRKPDKLPGRTVAASFALEYGESVLEAQVDALRGAERVVIIDDLLATGGTARAAEQVVSRLGAQVVAHLFLVELTSLQGRKMLSAPVFSVVQYD
jgi:adenine phosphoribosyltransferase